MFMDLLAYEPPLSWGPPPPRFHVATYRRRAQEDEEGESEEEGEEACAVREVATLLLSLAHRR